MEIICYGAGSGENPENTIYAIEQCVKLNPEWKIQIDVQLTKDGELVLFRRKYTKNVSSEAFVISETSFKKLNSINIATSFKKNGTLPFKNLDLKIPRLKEVFEKFPNTEFLIDIQSSNAKIVAKTISLIKQYNMQSKVIVTSKHHDIISLFDKTSDLKIAATTIAARKVIYENMFYVDNIIPEDADLLLIPKCDKDSLFLRKRIIKFCKQRNKKTWAWIFEENYKSNPIAINQIYELKNTGVDGIFTSFPSKLNSEMNINTKNTHLISKVG